MLLLLERLDQEGQLKHFTVLADAILQAEEVLQYVQDDRAIERFDRMVEHVLCQAYRGDRPMDELADRVHAALEMVPVPHQHVEPGTSESGEWAAVDEAPKSDSGTYDAQVSGTYEKYESGKYKVDEKPRPTGCGDGEQK